MILEIKQSLTKIDFFILDFYQKNSSKMWKDLSSLVVLLNELAERYEQVGDKYRAKSFAMGAMIVNARREKLPLGKDLLKVPGIGKSIAECIEEWFKTGKISRLEKMREETSIQEEVIEDEFEIKKVFRMIHGVGPKTADKWYERGWRSLEDIQKNIHLLTRAQRESFQNKFDLEKKIPRSEIETLEKKLEEIFKDFKWEICGSYRRKAKESGDIDILIQKVPDLALDEIVNDLFYYGLMVSNFTPDAKVSFRGLVRILPELPIRRLDIKLINEESWPSALLHFTGSSKLNVQMREIAKSKGWRLSEYGLFDGKGDRIECQSEEDIFKALDMKYLLPEERSD